MVLELAPGADFGCNRHCKTNPVDLEGSRGQVLVVEAGSCLREIHQERWGASPPTLPDGFPGDKKLLRHPTLCAQKTQSASEWASEWNLHYFSCPQQGKGELQGLTRSTKKATLALQHAEEQRWNCSTLKSNADPSAVPRKHLNGGLARWLVIVQQTACDAAGRATQMHLTAELVTDSPLR